MKNILFVCDKKGQIRYYYSRNHYNNLTNYINVLIFTLEMRIIQFSILASFSAILPTVRRYRAARRHRGENQARETTARPTWSY